MEDEREMVFNIWCREMFSANNEERIAYHQQPYESFSDYKNKNKQFLKQKYKEFL